MSKTKTENNVNINSKKTFINSIYTISQVKSIGEKHKFILESNLKDELIPTGTQFIEGSNLLCYGPPKWHVLKRDISQSNF